MTLHVRPLVHWMVSGLAGAVAWQRYPFPEGHPLLGLVQLERPALFEAIRVAYLTMLFTTPHITLAVGMSLARVLSGRSREGGVSSQLPPYPIIQGRHTPSVVIGEVHHAKRPEPAGSPRWLVIPERGLYTGVLVLGAIGSGKTSSCMVPFAEQLLAFKATDSQRRLSGLVLEVKGDFCHAIRRLLEKHGRGEDYLELSLEGDIRYNPLHNDLDAYALAYGIATLLNQLFGKSREPFWQQAYTNLLKFVILLHKTLDGYVTLFDVYHGAINPEYLERRIKEGEQRLDAGVVRVSFDDFMAVREFEDFPFERDPAGERMSSPLSRELRELLAVRGIRHEIVPHAATSDRWSDDQCAQFEAVRRWFYQDWLRIDARLRTSIVEGISVFLSLFDDNPAVKRVFCPPKETYDPVANADGRYGRPLPPFAQLLERGTVCALNFPVAMNPGLARTIGTLLKQDFQRAVLGRIPAMDREPERVWRPVLFLCDEYHSFATVGESDPSGDEKFFALSRQARCIPVVATHSLSSLRSTLPGESWRTLFQTFRTKVFLTLTDDASARTASDLCGREDHLRPSYSLSEQGQDAGVSWLSGRSAAQRASVGTSKTYSFHRDALFEPKVFAELKNAQAIVLAYDGLNPQPPTYCYLKPHYLDPNVSYFEHLAKGAL